MPWQFTPYLIPLSITAALAAVLAMTAWHKRPTPGAIPAAVIMLAALEWALTYGLELSSAHLEGAVWWARAQYLGISTIPVAWLTFTLEYADQRQWLSLRNLILLALIPGLTNILVWTNDLHRLIWTSVGTVPLGPIRVPAYQHGLWFWFFTGYSYLLIISGAGNLVRMLLHHNSLYRGQIASALVGGLVPWFTSIISITGLLGTQPLDLTPVAFTTSGLAMIWGLSRFRLLDIVPIGRDAVVEGMSDGVILLDAQGRIADLNPTMRRILGADTARLIGHSANSALAAWPALIDCWQGERAIPAQAVVGTPDGSRLYEVQITPLQDHQGRLTSRLITLHDITERQRLEEQLLQAHKMEVVGQLAGGIAHEFNNLLTVINGYSEFVLASLAPDDPARQDVETILTAGTRAARLTRQLLTFSRLYPVQTQCTDLNEVLRSMAPLVAPMLGDDIRLEMDLAGDLGVVMADVGQVEQIITNLAANGRDAMPNGGTLTLRTANVTRSGAGEQRDYVLLAIGDTGHGMTHEVKRHLFEPFFTTKEVGQGTGLGLATVYGIVEAFGGLIEVTSAPGRGTLFGILLPRVTPARLQPNLPRPQVDTFPSPCDG